ncbi:MAG: helix-turn-helix domain-containing protein [Rhizobiaceae bacterium]
MSSRKIPAPIPDSHRRALDVAWRLIAERGLENVTLAEIAREAGLSRQALYLFFGGRGGLLKAMTQHKDVASGIRQRFIEASRSSPVDQAIGRTVAVWFDYLPEIEPVAFGLQAESSTDEESRLAWSDRMKAFRDLFVYLARRLTKEDRLCNGWSEEEAADFMYALAGLSTWRSLVVDRGWAADRAATKVAEAILSVLVKPAPVLCPDA